jgi:SAM-dependent methyltransferase
VVLAAPLGTGLATAAAVLLGACLTRVYAVLYPSHGIILLLAFAASGAAAGALVTHRLAWWPGRSPAIAAAAAAATGGLAVLAGWLAIAGAVVNWPVANALLAYATFGMAGAALAAAVRHRPAAAAWTFGAQLAGGGGAALLTPAVLNWLTPIPALLLAAALFAAAGVVHTLEAVAARRTGAPARPPSIDAASDEEAGFAWSRLGRWLALSAAAGGAVLALVAFPLQLTAGWLRLDPARVASPKSLFRSIQDERLRERVLETTWDSFARTDVTELANAPDVRWVYLDGSVAGLMHRMEPGRSVPAALQADIGNIPFTLPGARDKVLVIGAGTGREVLLALAAGAKQVVAAEVSPGLLAAARRAEPFSGGWLSHPAVRVVEQDGRTFLRSTDEQFDVIYLSLATGGVAQPGGAAAGSYLYTIEAFGDYLDHLRQDGRLVIKLRDEQELTRAFNTAFQSLTGRGATPLQAIRRLLAINDQPLADRQGGGIVLPLLMVRKTPYLEDEARTIYEALRQTPYPPLFMPHLEPLSPFGAFAVEEIGPRAIEARAPYDIRPARDSSPFFFEFEKGFPWGPAIVLLVAAAAAGGAALLTRRPPAESLDLDLAAEGSEEAVAFLEDAVPWRFLAFAALAAGGFALVLFPLAYRLPLLVGHPTLAPALAYGAFLLAGVAGGVLAGRAAPRALRPVIGWAALAAGLLAVAAPEVLAIATSTVRVERMLPRAAVGALVVAPFGICFGVLFPSAVRLLATARRGGWAALLWAVSALAGTGAVLLALTIGLAWSFTYAMFLGAACLFAVFMMAGLRLLEPQAPEEEAEPAPADHTPFQRPVAPVAGEERDG